MKQVTNTYRQAYQLMLTALVVSWVVVSCVSAYSLYRSHQQVLDNAEVTAGNLSLSLEHYLRIHFEVTERILQQAAISYRQQTDQSINARSFSNELGRLQQLLPNNAGVRGADEQGNVLYGADLSQGKPLSVARRNFFIEARQSGQMVFGLPLKSRITGDWVLPIVQPLQKSDGSFGGVVYVNSDIKTVASTFSAINVGAHGSVVLFDSDRRVYLRFPTAPAAIDEQVFRFGSPELISILASGRTEASFQSTSTIDGVQRMADMRKIGKYPLYVMVGLGKDEYLAEWYGDVRKHVIFLLLLAATCAIFAALLKFSWQNRELALQETLLKEKELEHSLEALSSSEEQFRTLAEGLPLMSWVADAQMKTRFFSPQAAVFAGCPVESLVENNAWIEYVHPDDRCHILGAWKKSSDAGGIYQAQCRVRRHDGVWRTLEVRGLPQRNSEGEIVAWVGCNYDITESMEAREELAAAREAAEAATLAKSAFLANMSHEIRTPMNGVLGIAHLMRRGNITPLQAQQLDKIAASGNHLLGIINDILDLSKIEAGKVVLEEEDFSLDDLLHDVLAVIGDGIHAKGLALVINMAGMPQMLRGDATRLRQALVNYLSNALKFTALGTITLQGRVLEEMDDGYRLRFEVSDTGIGIPAELKDRLFAAFEQADKSTTRKYGGSGLGLAINQRIARLMGGEVGFDSVPGVGSTFWLTACLGRGKDLSAYNADRLLENAETIIRNEHSGKRVLIAEDEPINQEVTSELLRAVGLEPIIAENGAKALSMARQGNFDLILMDMQMPEMDGVEATRAIRKIPGFDAVPIVAMTANAFDENRETCIAAGMNDFVTKPADPEVLFSTLLKWLKLSGKRDHGAGQTGMRF